MTDSFVFYRSFRDAIRELPDEDRLAVYDAICGYALDNDYTPKTVVAGAIMTLIKPQIDANFRKRQNGSQGGRPKNEPKDNLDETKTKPSDNLDVTEPEPNVNVSQP